MPRERTKAEELLYRVTVHLENNSRRNDYRVRADVEEAYSYLRNEGLLEGRAYPIWVSTAQNRRSQDRRRYD